MRVKKQPLWVNFQVLGYIVGGLAALGTVIVVSNKYIVLPQKVEAAEEKNVQQDKQIDRLITLQEYYQKQNVAQQQYPQPWKVWKEQDKDGAEYCTDGKDTWGPNRRGECE